MREFQLKTETVITDRRIADIVVTAFEGGSSYWCSKAEPVERDDNGEWQLISAARFEVLGGGHEPMYDNPEYWDNDKRGYRLYDEYDEIVIPKVLTLAGIIKALQWQQPKPTPKEKQYGINPNWYRKVVDRIKDEEYDAADADAVVQIAVFNEVVYG